jgi:hypothetical protein
LEKLRACSVARPIVNGRFKITAITVRKWPFRELAILHNLTAADSPPKNDWLLIFQNCEVDQKEKAKI